jgi:hypothetical protein
MHGKHAPIIASCFPHYTAAMHKAQQSCSLLGMELPDLTLWNFSLPEIAFREGGRGRLFTPRNYIHNTKLAFIVVLLR